MGEVLVPTCDISRTMQPKGLRTIHVEVTDTAENDSTSDSGKVVCFECDLGTSERGFTRVLRMIKQACSPPKKREAKGDA